MNASFSQNCIRCGHVMKGGINRIQCTQCKAFNLGSTETIKPKTVLLKDVGASEHIFVKTGPWDPCFGELGEGNYGMILTGLTLLGGSKGAGKSTLILSIAEALSKARDGEVLYINTEEDKSEIEIRAKRFEIDYSRIRVMQEMSSLDDAFLEGLYTSSNPPKGIILDSFTGTVGDNRELAKALILKLKRITVKHKCPTIAIDQLLKDGSLAGPEFIGHGVDTVLGLTYNERTKIRRLYPIKNRFGPSDKEVYFDMTRKGLILHSCKEKDCEICETT